LRDRPLAPGSARLAGGQNDAAVAPPPLSSAMAPARPGQRPGWQTPARWSGRGRLRRAAAAEASPTTWLVEAGAAGTARRAHRSGGTA